MLLVDPIGGARYCSRDLEDLRLERLPAPPNVRDRASGPIISPTRGSDYDIPLTGDRKHLIVSGTLKGSITTTLSSPAENGGPGGARIPMDRLRGSGSPGSLCDGFK